MLLKRIISGLIISCFIIVIIFISEFVWFLGVCFLSYLCNNELQKLFESKGYQHAYKLTTIFSLFIITISYLLCISYDTSDLENLQLFHNCVLTYQNLALGIGLIITFITFLFISQPRVSIADISTTIFGIIYLGWFPSYLILIRHLPYGAFYVFWVLLGPSFCDITAFFVGKYLGKHKFFPDISPNKTIEGAVGGLLGCTLVTVICGYFFKIIWYHSLIMGIILGIIAQVGDLGESILKRDAGKKDSGNIIPGHGGILDRLDSYILIGFIPYFYIVKFIIGT